MLGTNLVRNNLPTSVRNNPVNWLRNLIKVFLGTKLLALILIVFLTLSFFPLNAFAFERPIRLTLVSYTVTQNAYDKIIPQFIKYWKQTTGQKVIVDRSYGPSEAQTRAIINGLEADIVAPALSADIKELEAAQLLQAGWEKKFPYNSIVHKSVAAIAIRDDSIQVKSWSDLAQDNLKIIIANPKSSGGARWDFLMLWQSALEKNANEANALNFVKKVYKNALILPRDSREATMIFYRQRQGNVLINFENELIFAESKGQKSPYIIPRDYNISIENPVAIVDANVDKHENREVAEAFVQFLFTPEAQRIFAQIGFRPVNETVMKEFELRYPQIENLIEAQDLGSWEDINHKFFEQGAVFEQIFSS